MESHLIKLRRPVLLVEKLRTDTPNEYFLEKIDNVIKLPCDIYN